MSKTEPKYHLVKLNENTIQAHYKCSETKRLVARSESGFINHGSPILYTMTLGNWNVQASDGGYLRGVVDPEREDKTCQAIGATVYMRSRGRDCTRILLDP